MIINKMRVVSLFSGSKGNCTFIDTGTANLLIDAGGSAKAIECALSGLGVGLCDISGIYITHEHTDHTGSLPVIAKKYGIPIHISRACAGALCPDESSCLGKCLVIHPAEYISDIGDNTEIEAFIAPHDSVQCVGYRITCPGGSVGIATDLGYVTQRVYDMLCGCGAVIIESNHDRDMVKNGPYTAALKRRILSNGGHLSNDDCAEVAAALAKSGTRTFMLAHLSRDNNKPELALSTVRTAVSSFGASVVAASPDKITVLV